MSGKGFWKQFSFLQKIKNGKIFFCFQKIFLGCFQMFFENCFKKKDHEEWLKIKYCVKEIFLKYIYKCVKYVRNISGFKINLCFIKYEKIVFRIVFKNGYQISRSFVLQCEFFFLRGTCLMIFIRDSFWILEKYEEKDLHMAIKDAQKKEIIKKRGGGNRK